MSFKLTSEDTCAVDLMLERDPSNNQDLSSCFSHQPSVELQQRLTRAESLLGLLNHFGETDPSADLLSRTLSHCARAPMQTDPASLPEIPPEPGGLA